MAGFGVPFGATAPGGELLASRQVVALLLNRMREHTQDTVEKARYLAETIDRIQANYQDADEATVQRLMVIRAALERMTDQAVAIARQSPNPLDGS